MVAAVHDDRSDRDITFALAVAKEIDHHGTIGKRVPFHDNDLSGHFVTIELADEKAEGALDALDIAFHVPVVAHPSDDA
jgi:hypothetical protein